MTMQRISEKSRVKKLNEQEIEMKEFFESIKLEMTVHYIAEVKFSPEDKYPMDKFTIVFRDQDTGNVQSFDYYQGMGHRIKRESFSVSRPFITIVKPSIADVMYNLLSDYECGQMTFEDFCSDLDYNYDSIKDMNLHRELVEQKNKVAKYFGLAIPKMQKILEDY